MTSFAFVLGYVAGSVSGARLVGRSIEFGPTEVIVDGAGSSVVVDGVSPSMLRAREGDSAGLRAAAIDIAKAAVPALVARIVWGRSSAAAAGTGAVLGHVFPAHRGFRGGFGMSPLMGAMAVIDPVGLVVTIIGGMAAGAAAGSAFAMTDIWPALTIPWFRRRRDGSGLAFATASAAVYFWRSRREMMAAWKGWRTDDRPWIERVADITTYPAYRPGVV
ncbi:MAG: glycerol-3-phosphate acyltransferase [Acidimicrobiia bacterium]|nr:glycerol-3-phosphate acyltransferase [Acidimicrobiia bacterium]